MGRPRYLKKIFALFLAAAMAPAAGISLVYTALAGAALGREAASRQDSQAAVFARQVASMAESSARELAAMASDPALLAALVAGATGNPALTARAFRRVQATFPRSGGIAEASVLSLDGKVALVLGDTPPDRDMAAYGSWGIFRALAETELAVAPRVARLSDGSASSFTVGLAIRDDEGHRLGYALADIRRQAIASAAMAAGLQGGASLRFPSGKVVFDQSDPSKEGFFSDSPGPPDSKGFSQAKASGAGTEFMVLVETPAGLYDGFGRAARNVALVGLAAAAALATMLALRASSSVTEPVLAMARSMKLVEAGDLSIRIEPSGDDELGDLARSFNAMTAEIDALLKRETERQELLRAAELRALAAQMNPHFLHNTLATIKSLAKLGRQAEIAEVVSRLGKILRASAGRRDGTSTIGDSLKLVRDYLSIEQIRFGERFAFFIDVDPALERLELPPLTLEPMAENALTHGLERKRGHGTLRIMGWLDGRDALVSFEDDGPGMDAGAMALLSKELKDARPPSGNHGIGLLGTNRRLVLEYGPGYGLQIGAGTARSGGFRVVLRVPAGGQA